MNHWFAQIASAMARACGHPLAFVLATASIVVWIVSGPLFAWSDTWQLVINTATTVITFLMVFLIQNSQNRDTLALHAKLDELVHAVGGARDELERAEEKDESEIEALRQGSAGT